MSEAIEPDELVLRINRLIAVTETDTTTLVRNNYDIVKRKLNNEGDEDAYTFHPNGPRYGVPMATRLAIYTCELIKRGELKE